MQRTLHCAFCPRIPVDGRRTAVITSPHHTGGGSMAAPHREDVQRVLYVDDDPVSRRIFEQLGKSAHVLVDACGSLDEAFAFARQHPYSVIAADYSLRRWDGLSVLRELSGLQAQASLMLVTD